jgi:hypothetical protein
MILELNILETQSGERYFKSVENKWMKKHLIQF